MTRQEAFMEATEWVLEHAGSILAEALNQRAEAMLAAADDVCGAMSYGHRCDVTGLHTRHVAENAGEGGADYAWETPRAALARAGEQEGETMPPAATLEAWHAYFDELCDVLFPESLKHAGRLIGWKHVVARAKELTARAGEQETPAAKPVRWGRDDRTQVYHRWLPAPVGIRGTACGAAGEGMFPGDPPIGAKICNDCLANELAAKAAAPAGEPAPSGQEEAHGNRGTDISERTDGPDQPLQQGEREQHAGLDPRGVHVGHAGVVRLDGEGSREVARQSAGADSRHASGNEVAPPPGEQGKGGGEGTLALLREAFAVISDYAPAFDVLLDKIEAVISQPLALAQPAEHPASGGEWVVALQAAASALHFAAEKLAEHGDSANANAVSVAERAVDHAVRNSGKLT